MGNWNDFHFEMVRGDDHTEEFEIVGGDPLVAVDISGWLEFWFVLRRYPSDPDAVAALTKTGGGITFSTAGTDGKLKVTIPHAATAALPNWRQTLYGELQGKNASGSLGTPMQGTVDVQPEIVTVTS